MPEVRSSKILIVEDDRYSRVLLERILTNRKLDITAASDGEEALGILAADGTFDIVLSDWMMPKLDGVELCARIKTDPKLRQVYFILLTSRSPTEDKVTALNAGVDDYVTKPCHQEELIARINAGLRIRSLQSDLMILEKDMAILQVAATAGHEINNPLTGIIGYLDLLREEIESDGDTAKLLGYLDRIAGQAERIRDVVSKLISLKDTQTKPYLGSQFMLDLHRD